MAHPNGPRTGRPPAYAPSGVVSTPHYLASAAGLDALRRGGSAVDAAIAANAVLCVAYPHMAGLGGDGFWLIAEAGTGRVHAIDASGPAAARATLDYYRPRSARGSIPARGPLGALTVPGAVDGWRLAHERFGMLAWDSLFEAATGYARDGVPVSRSLADWLAADESVLASYPGTAAVYLPGGRVLAEGEKLLQTDLARSLEQVASRGARQGFYEGDIAERICAALTSGGSVLAAEDFAGYQAEWVEPITSAYRGYDVYEMPPPTQGFTALAILNLLDGYDVTAWGEGTADYYHHIAEAVKVAFADRDEWLTDPRFVDIPVAEFISKKYADARRSLIDGDRAMDIAAVPAGIPYPRRHEARVPDGDTCYFCAADSDGMVVSLIQSIYHDFGSAVVAGDTGIIAQNRGSFFSLDENHPNCLAPGKRTFHTLAPAMLLKDGKPYLAFGSMGGEGQPQSQAAMATRVIDFGYDVQQAIEAPRWLMGRTWGTPSRNLSLEGRISDETARELTRRGQPVVMATDWNDNMGHAQAIRVDRASGFLEGGADPRGDGAALGYLCMFRRLRIVTTGSEGEHLHGERVIEDIGADECLRLISAGGVGRIGYTGTDGGQAIRPVNYRLVDGAIVFRTVERGALDEDLRTGIADAEYRVAFEVDHLDHSAQAGWSVLVQGPAHHLSEAERAELPEPGLVTWAGGSREMFVRITPSRVTGRRVRPA